MIFDNRMARIGRVNLMTYVWEAVDKLTGSVYKVFKNLGTAQEWLNKSDNIQRFFLRRGEYFGK